jgi:hypothetical protein
VQRIDLTALLIVCIIILSAGQIRAGEAKSPWQVEWEKTTEAAKKEGKLVAAIPASAELRKAIGEIFPKRFPGIELDLTNARPVQRRQDRCRACRGRALFRLADQRHRDAI